MKLCWKIFAKSVSNHKTEKIGNGLHYIHQALFIFRIDEWELETLFFYRILEFFTRYDNDIAPFCLFIWYVYYSSDDALFMACLLF